MTTAKRKAPSLSTPLALIDTDPVAAISPGGMLHHDFSGPSWDRWRAVLLAAFGRGAEMTDEQLRLFREVAGDRDPPPQRVKELWIVAGRRAGKDSIASAIATVAATADYRPYLRTGEKATIACFASDRSQAGIIFGYIAGNFAGVSHLKPLVKSEADGLLALSNSVDVLVTTANRRAIRGRTVCVAILDELAYWATDLDAANSDGDIFAALEPSLISIPGSMIIGISTPAFRKGLLYDRWAEHFGKNTADVLVIQGGTRTFNAKMPQQTIDRRLREAPEMGAAEYLAEWLSGTGDFIDRELVAGAVDPGVVARPPVPGVSYSAFVDSSGGRGSSFAAAIAHGENGNLVLDSIFERRPPFSPDTVAEEVCALLREYNVSVVTGDRFGGAWTADAFETRGIRYLASGRDKSELYSEVLPAFTTGRARLLDDSRLTYQLTQLERKVGRNGKETIQPQPGSSDDLANVCAGALVTVKGDERAILQSGGIAEMLAPHPDWCRHIFSVLVFTPDGIVAEATFAEHGVRGVLDPPCFLIGAHVGKLTTAPVTAAKGRLEEAVRSIRRVGGIHTIYLPRAQLQLAWMEGFSDGPTDARSTFSGVTHISDELGKDLPALAIELAAHAGAGRFRVSEVLWREKSRMIPLAGALQQRPGEKIEANPLKTAILLGLEMCFPRRR